MGMGWDETVVVREETTTPLGSSPQGTMPRRCERRGNKQKPAVPRYSYFEVPKRDAAEIV